MSSTAPAAALESPSISSTKVSSGSPVAASALAMDSVDGQRARPSAVMRFDLLKEVGSRPARRASPEAVNPARAARRSMADQTCACVNIDIPLTPLRTPRLPARVQLRLFAARSQFCTAIIGIIALVLKGQ